jgi:hypothetical protein
MSNLIQIHLNSSQATTVLGSSSWLFELPHSLIYDPRASIQIELTNAEIPFSYYTVNNNNHLLSIKIGSNTHNISLTNGNYTCDEIAEQFHQLFTAAGHAVTVTYNLSTNKMVFSCPSENIQIRSSSTCLKLIGFTPGQNTSTDHILTSDLSCDVMTVERFIIVSSINVDNITSGQSAAHGGILCSFSLNASFNGVNLYDGKGYRFQCDITNLSTISLIVYDQEFNQIDFNGIASYFTLSIISR